MKKNIIVIDRAIDLGLPKWPAMAVVGKTITNAQATEIIIRTDMNVPDFEYASNDRRLNQELAAIFGVPIHNDIFQKSVDDRFDIMVPHWAARDRLKKRLKILPLSYLNNSQIASSFVGGPHGWCSWGGNIFTNSYNIGKWPSAETVAEEWAVIAKAFPFLELDCQLHDEETCEEPSPVVNFRVRGGTVTVHPPREVLIPIESHISSWCASIAHQDTRSRESGINPGVLAMRLKQVYGGRVPQYRLSRKDVEERKRRREERAKTDSGGNHENDT